jgi:type II secretory pathway component PulM
MMSLQRRERRLLIVASVATLVVVGYLYRIDPLMARRERCSR